MFSMGFAWELTKPHSLTMCMGNLNLLCNSRYVVWSQATFQKMINLFLNVVAPCGWTLNHCSVYSKASTQENFLSASQKSCGHARP